MVSLLRSAVNSFKFSLANFATTNAKSTHPPIVLEAVGILEDKCGIKVVGVTSDVMLCYVMLCYVMLCYVMLCYVMLCYVMLCYVMLCYVMLCYVMLCYVMLCYVMLCYVMLCYVMLCYVMLCYVMLCYVMLCYVMLCYVMLCYVMLCYVMLCYVMLCYVMLCYVMLCYVCLFNVSFNNSRCSLIQTNLKQFQGLHKALHLVHKEHVHFFHGTKCHVVDLGGRVHPSFPSGRFSNSCKSVEKCLGGGGVKAF